VLQCDAVCCSSHYGGKLVPRNKVTHVVCDSVLQCVAVCRSVLQCVAVRCSVMQRGAVCCSVLQCVYKVETIKQVPVTVEQLVPYNKVTHVCYSVLQCIAVCLQSGDNQASARDSGKTSPAPKGHGCALKCIAACCNVLQCVYKVVTIEQVPVTVETLVLHNKVIHTGSSVLQFVAVCCSDANVWGKS